MSILCPVLLATAPALTDRPYDLMVGDPAPAIEVRAWEQGEPIESFERGEVYVVEFWATWCGPCIQIIPHMNELSKQYAGRASFVGISVRERIEESAPYAVPSFLERMGERMTYTVGADRTEEAHEARMDTTWMRAAGEPGIPTAFIVDRTGTLAWIGSPYEIDEPLAAIVAGEWDLDAAVRRHTAAKMRQALIEETRAKVDAALAANDVDGAVAAIEATMEQDAATTSELAMTKFQVLMSTGDAERVAVCAGELVDDVYAQDPYALNQIAWALVDPATSFRPATDLAVRAAKRGCELMQWKGASVMDTYARALFTAGNVGGAVEVQARAVELVAGSPSEQAYRRVLEEYEAEVGEAAAEGTAPFRYNVF